MNDVSFEKVEKNNNFSFSVIAYSNPFFAAPLHIHPEYELILIEEGGGLIFVGDSVHKMSPGNFMLIGKNLPHLWLSSDPYYEKNSPLISRSVYTQFCSSIFPPDLHLIPELEEIHKILLQSQRGLTFYGDRLEALKEDFRNLVSEDGYKKWVGFYQLLFNLATECQYQFLTSEGFEDHNMTRQDNIINKAHDYMNKNYSNDISLEDIANYSGMNSSALCRYYKKRTGKTMFEYLSELRISYAVKLLANRNITISQVAYDCGYNSLSHFNHQFKGITGRTPSEYCKKLVYSNE